MNINMCVLMRMRNITAGVAHAHRMFVMPVAYSKLAMHELCTRPMGYDHRLYMDYSDYAGPVDLLHTLCSTDALRNC